MKKKALFALVLVVGIAKAQDTTTSSNNFIKPLPVTPEPSIAPAPAPVNQGEIHGNIQMDAQYYNPDPSINADPVKEKMNMNGFANINYIRDNFSAGVRYESYLNPLLGFPNYPKGSGIPYRYASYKVDDIEITVGNYYDQFGNGLVFRSYEERGLGLDNAMDGLRIKYKPFSGIYLKGIIGKQRLSFSSGPGIVRGADGEIQLNEMITSLNESKTRISFGGSFVSKFQEGDTSLFPLNVGASSGRFTLIHGNFSLSSEYAYKIPDPSDDNGNIYKDGQALILKTSYATKGTAFSFNAKRTDNMSFRSDRTAKITALLINYLPAYTKQHTYGLLTIYPYTSQPTGEIAFQGEFQHKFPKETPLGGPYGMDLSINYSQANGLDTTQIKATPDKRPMGYKVNNYFGFGQDYFKELVVEINRKFSKKVKVTLLYANQMYNIAVIQGHPNHPNIFTNIGVIDLTYKIKNDKALRFEAQNLLTKQDSGSWTQGLIEYTHGEHWFGAVLDQYNYGNQHPDKRIHYVNASIGYIKNATRITLSYGKQRAGLFCVGGVCRTVPASNGITLSITSSF